MEDASANPWVSHLLIPVGPREPAVGRLGGHPRGIRAEEWPRCRVCGQPMCHMGQLDAGPYIDLGRFARMTIFICHATGGRCEDWDPWKGANRVVLQADADDNLYDGPPTVRVYKRRAIGLGQAVDERTLMDQVQRKERTLEDALREIKLDKIGGGAVWIHGDANPRNRWNRPMRLIAQLTTHIVRFDITPTGMAYIFLDDESEEGEARLLWQGS